jgi:ribosomal protein L44E
MTYCKECLKKQHEINELQEEIDSLKNKLRYQQRTTKEGYFGSSTPSSKIPVKPNRCTELRYSHGGGKVGHKGYGRSSICQDDADIVETVAAANPDGAEKACLLCFSRQAHKFFHPAVL